MDEYIKRKDAFEILQSRLDGISQMSYLDMDWRELDIMRNAIENAIDDVGEVPSADVQPVRHGRWIWDSNAPHREHGAYKCSNCGCHSDFEENYCYNCGARMDLKDTDTNG